MSNIFSETKPYRGSSYWGRDYRYIYYGDCHHYFTDDIRDDRCLKRYFEVTGIFGKSEKTFVVVCNDYLRLLLRKESHHKFTDRRDHYHYAISIIERIINEALPEEHPSPRNMSIINPSFSYTICEKPFLLRSISLSDALALIVDPGNKDEYLHCSFRDNLVRAIDDIAEHFLRYKKYSKYHTEMRKIKKIAYRGGLTRDNSPVLDMVSMFFEMQIKMLDSQTPKKSVYKH